MGPDPVNDDSCKGGELKSQKEGKYMKETRLLNGEGKAIYQQDAETTEKKIPYPRSVFFIVGNEFCERFSYYGMKAILPLYLKYQLLYSEDDATIIYHVWSMLIYFMPLFGAIIADSMLGRYKTILYVSILYMLGNAVFSFSAITPIFPLDNLAAKNCVAMIGLVIIAFGTGGIKPCVSAFGGDQFTLPQQERQLTQFFSVFYFSINAGSLISTFLTPILRDDVKCYGEDCYALAFGVPAILMFVATALFVFGSATYKKVPPKGNIMMEVTSCIVSGIKGKIVSHEKKEHWLDHAEAKFELKLIEDVKILLKVLLLYIPLPFFWALFDQQGSRWTFQATRMDGTIGGWTLKPDQMQVLNPFLILAFIPLFDTVIYPTLSRCGILRKPLQRIFAGGALAAVAFLISGFVELSLENTYPVAVNSHESRIVFINSLPCDIAFNCSVGDDNYRTAIPKLSDQGLLTDHTKLDQYTFNLDRGTTGELKIDILFTEVCHLIENQNIQPIVLNEGKAQTILFTASDADELLVKLIDPEDDYEKSQEGLPKVRMLYNLPENSSITLEGKHKTYNLTTTDYIGGTDFILMEPDTYNIFNSTNSDISIGSIQVHSGGVYNFLVERPLNNDTINIRNFEITSKNSVHMLWLIPQYIVITVSEVLFSITGLEFSFSQAPASMKSVLQAAWLLTMSFGNVIVIIVAEAKFFDRQSMEFFLFAGLMFIDILAFAALAGSYKYVENKGDNKNGKLNSKYNDEETKF